MKKLTMVMAVTAMIAGFAYASSLAVPWFADNSPEGAGWPPNVGMTTLIYLKSNVAEDLSCEISYFSDTGEALGPDYPDNVFVIPAMSTVAFRPVSDDPVPNGQESEVAQAIPNRPRDVNTKKNGSASISWVGGPNDVQGMVASTSNAMSYAHLLPPGN